MDAYNLTPVFCETGQEVIGSFSWKDKLKGITPCLIFGHEARGIDPGLIWYSKIHYPESFCVSVPQRGVMRSLNVSAAAAIMMHNIGEHYVA